MNRPAFSLRLTTDSRGGMFSRMQDTREEAADPEHPDADAPAPKWRAVLVLAVVLIAVAVSQTILRRSPPPADGKQPSVGAATIRFEGLDGPAWAGPIAVDLAPGATVLSATRAVRADAASPLAVEVQGSGANAFVLAIGGKPNEGAGGRNWLYSLNEEPGAVGAGAQPLEPGDRVLWKFTADGYTRSDSGGKEPQSQSDPPGLVPAS